MYGEIGVTCKAMHQQVAGKHQSADHRPEIQKRWQIWRQEKERRLKDDRGRGLSSMAVFDALTRLAPEDAIMTVDVGNRRP